jgi:hypothetical protein
MDQAYNMGAYHGEHIMGKGYQHVSLGDIALACGILHLEYGIK